MGSRARVLLRASVVLGLSVAGLSLTTTPASADEAELSLVSVGSNGTMGSDFSYFAGAAPDGSRVYFTTINSLVPADTDGPGQDIYERAGGVTTLISTGATDPHLVSGTEFGAVSVDGSRVLFLSSDRLAADDEDNAQDLYERAGGVTTLVSLGTQTNGPNLSAFFEAASADGSVVAFTSLDRLVPADTNDTYDLYVRAGGVTTLISGAAGPRNYFPENVLMSADGSRISFMTADKLLPADDDNAQDVYLWDANGLHLLSEAPAGGLDNLQALPEQMSSTGAVLFSTEESLVMADTDITRDSYLATPGQPVALVTGSGSQSVGVTSDLMSGDGQHLVYITKDPVSGQVGVHRVDGGQYTAVPLSGPATASYPEVRHVSPDGTRALIEGNTRLTANDTDIDSDVYLLTGTTLSLLTPASPGDAYAFAWATDLRRVVYSTESRVLPSDTDDYDDSYAVAGGQTTLVTPDTTADGAAVMGMSADGRVMWFETLDSLRPADTNTTYDVYQVSMLAPSSTGLPSITGTPAPGQTLACLQGSWRGNPNSFAYQWNRDGALIDGSTAATYAVQAGDAGHALSCTVTASNTDGSASATSAAVAVPAVSTPPPAAPPVLKPGPCANVQAGTVKADQLTGTTAGDKLIGRGGADVLRGLGQADCLFGGGGKDKLKGGPSNDLLVGGPKQDTLLGGGGKDIVRSRDGVVDVVKCGGGRDKVVGDKVDKLVGCEVKRLN